MFENSNYLLDGSVAEKLYFGTARDLPIIDFHNHLNYKEIVSGYVFDNIAEVWVKSDPYKHRAMRIMGVPEKNITGDASDFEKFEAWCTVFPYLIGNALYHWSLIEMREIFNIETPICAQNAKRIWDEAGEKLRSPEYSAAGLYRKFNIEYSAPCVSLLDDLSPFEKEESLCPSLRGDTIYGINRDFIEMLSSSSGLTVDDTDSFSRAIDVRLDCFDNSCCRFPDHALDAGFRYFQDDGKNDERFHLMMEGSLSGDEYRALQSHILRIMAVKYSSRGWTMQLHIGALRSTSSRLRKAAGAAGGYAGIGSTADIKSVVAFLNDVEELGGLPKTILYTLNPNDHAALSVLSGSFSQDCVPAKITEGPAWWWCDHYQGIREMLDNFAAYSVLSTFVGMTTDSRSIMSLQRHDYFRRLLCTWVSQKVSSGEFPDDTVVLSEIIKRLSYGNAAALIRR